MLVKMDSGELRRLRRAKGLTQEQLAEKAGLSDRYVRSLEKRAVRASIEVLYNLSAALETPMESLVAVYPEPEE